MQNNFEKQVQQKMDELRFEPTPPVWQKVALQIQTEKKRRRLFIWLPLLALLIAGGIWWMVQLENSTANIATNGQQSNDAQQTEADETNIASQKINQRPADVNATSKKINTPVVQADATIAKSKPENENENVQLTNGQPANTALASIKNTGSAVQQKNAEKRNAAKQIANSVAVETNVTEADGDAEKKLETVAEKSLNSAADEKLETGFDKTLVTGADKKIIVAATATEMELKKAKPVVLDNNPPTNFNQQKSLAPIINKPAVKDSNVVQKIASAIQADTTVAVQSTVIIQLPTKNKWLLQVHAAAGITGLSSGINLFSGLFGSEKSMADATGLAIPQPATSSARRAPSSVSNGFGVSIGASAEKKISNRLSFSAGLQYNYYSTSITVGQLTRQDSVARNSLQLNQFYANSGTAFSNKTNSYHFLSLPVSLQWRVNKKLPLYFSTGFSLQQLMAVNAVLYDGGSNIYYPDNNAFNKTQLFTHASISYRVINNKKFSLQLGPQLQYGLSQLEKNKSGNHLFAAAIGTQISFSGK